ncbi:MAG: DUF3142 domain-containing protein [Fimbriimonadaceae bacterium]|nr:DUF3142 domain-containing protein [Fimbriimonadaceae bacterium]
MHRLRFPLSHSGGGGLGRGTGRLFLGVLLIALGGCKNEPVAQRPLEASVWYWHSPFDGIEDLGIKQIFVRAATITCEEGHLLVPRIQDFREVPKLPTTLVINLEASVVSQLSGLREEDIAAKVAEVYGSMKAKVVGKGGEVLGLQVDFDSPTSKLPQYEEILRGLRERIQPDDLSITALPTWLSSKEFNEVAKQVDYFVPQFYEGRLGKTLDDPGPISDLEGLRRGLMQADKVGVPYWAGIAGYGHAALYDSRGHLVGTYKELSPTEALAHPDLKLEDVYPADARMKPATASSWIGEDVLRFRAIRPDARGRGLGHTILYKVPSGALLSQQIAIVQAHRSSSLRGFIAFRYPQPMEQLALPAATLRDAFAGSKLAAKLEVKMETTRRPFGLIENPRDGKAANAVTIRITNVGNESTATAPRAIVLRLATTVPGIEVSDRSSFPCRLFDDSGLRAGPGRARLAEFTIPRLGPGQSAVLGPIVVSGEPNTVSTHLDWSEPGGFVRRSLVDGVPDTARPRD